MDPREAFSRRLKSVEGKKEEDKFQVRNIDFIYLINLDKRADRLARCMRYFSPFQIRPHRVAGIDGWSLGQDYFNDIATPVSSPTRYGYPVHFRFVVGGTPGERITEADVGRPCLHREAPGGGMGGAMTHASILNDACQSGYQVAWVLEDDFTVKGNPHLLADYIDRLDQCVGREGWDVLYTDDDSYYSPENVRAHLGGVDWIRPGVPFTENLIERKAVGADFFKIGGRTQAHSVIYSRTGMEKIVDYLKTNHFFFPYDTELPCIPGINLFNLKYDIVHGRDRTYSDTYHRR